MLKPRAAALWIMLLLLIPPAIQANPGGNGDGDRDMQCGGSCHGDPGLSMPSSAVVELSLDRSSVYAGATLGVSVTISDGELSNRHLMAVFLLSSLNGAGDHPEDDGWRILQDPNGGSANSVELLRHSSTYPLIATWILQAPDSVGSHTLFASVHHGASPNDADLAYFALNDSGLVVDVGPIPDNLPQLHPDWTPPGRRLEGVASEFSVRTVNTSSMEVEWKLEGDENAVSAAVEVSAEGDWTVELPATLAGTNISYRITMTNEDYEESTPWLQLTTEEIGFEVDMPALRLQMLGLMLLAVAVSLSLQRGLLRRTRSPTAVEMMLPETAMAALPEMPGVPAPSQHNAGPPLPLGGLPPGWTEEQWAHYGVQYLQGGDK